jgi:hypothetical protein
MGSQTFDISSATGGGAEAQNSSTLTLAAGEIVRVRFTQIDGSARAYLGVTRNTVTTYSPIFDSRTEGPDEEQDYIGAALEGDVVFVRIVLQGDSTSRAVGILETI